jgi:hypothetical protein
MRLRLLPIAAAAVFSSTRVVIWGFTIPSSSNHQPIIERRSFLSNLLVRTSSTLLIVPIVTSSSRSNAAVIPSVTTAEFDVILKDSAKSIVAVELSGPKSETAIVRLVDGTTFTISDLVESSTDPRSPLKLVARCRLYKIPIKNTGLLSAVSGGLISDSGKKTKSYMNPRVQEAEKKEQAKRERMAEDERDRLEQLYKLEGEEKGFLVE